jgi:hypothetical protein
MEMIKKEIEELFNNENSRRLFSEKQINKNYRYENNYFLYKISPVAPLTYSISSVYVLFAPNTKVCDGKIVYNKDFKNPLDYERKLHEKSGIEIFNESVYDMFYTNEKLKECCKMNKIKNYSKMNKLELRKSLMNI